MNRLSTYAQQRQTAVTGPLDDFDRQVVAALAAGCRPEARAVARWFGRPSWSAMHLVLVRLGAHGIVRIEHGRKGTARLADDIIVIANDVCRMIPLKETR